MGGLDDNKPVPCNVGGYTYGSKGLRLSPGRRG